MYLQNVQEENVNPEQIIETAEKVLLLLNNHRDLILQEEMPVLSDTDLSDASGGKYKTKP